MARPPVSVVMPFHGGDEDARGALGALGRLQLRDGDELLVADNTPDGVMARHAAPPVTRVPAPEVASSYFARNAGADRAANEWLLFLDADTHPSASLLDDYFAEPVADDVGAVAGEVVGADGQTALAARYSRSRRHIGQADLREHPYRPMAVTASLLVRARALRELGGFLEGMRSSGDADFSWRLQDAGWKLAYTQRAVVEHHHRETMHALLRVAARYGAGRTWLQRRHPGARFPSPLRGLARCAAGVAVWTVTLQFERALFKVIDALWIVAEAAGSLAGNVAPDPGGRDRATFFIADRFPVRGNPLARVAASADPPARIEAAARPERPDREAGRGLRARYREDDGPARRLLDLAWVTARHPLRSARHGRLGGAPLRTLAPAARRLAASRAERVQALAGSAAEPDALRVAGLLGIPCTLDPGDTGPAPQAASEEAAGRR
ncbi:MAG: glycosyltransferase family 2 protein [Thermoleophilaceae bacterium]